MRYNEYFSDDYKSWDWDYLRYNHMFEPYARANVYWRLGNGDYFLNEWEEVHIWDVNIIFNI